MAPKLITLVRHGQAHHNVDEKYHLHDPYLTPLGESQCRTIPDRFPKNLPPVSLLVSSPLKRTLQTTLIGFPNELAAKPPVPLYPLPELQETSSMPCDTGSAASEIVSDPHFAHLNLDFSHVPEDWTSKSGKWSSNPNALRERAKWVRDWLKQRDEEHVVCVLHGGFLHYLTEDWRGHGDLPGTGWANAEFRHYVWKEDDVEGTNSLVETKESRESRERKPLGKTEAKEFEESHNLPN